MPKLKLIEDTIPPWERPEDRDTQWWIDCDCTHWGGRPSRYCRECHGGGGYYADKIDPVPACKVEDHRWKIEFDAGSTNVYALDPCDRVEWESMVRHGGYPACREKDGFVRDGLSGEIEVKLTFVDDSTPSTPNGPAESGYYIEVHPLMNLTDEARAAAKAKAQEWEVCSPTTSISAEAAVQIAQAAIDALNQEPANG